MLAVLLVISAALVQAQAQYSNVRYQPGKGDSYADYRRDFDKEQDLSNYYRVPEVDAPQTFGVPADSYEVPAYIYTGTLNPDAQQKNKNNFENDNNAATEFDPEVNKKDREEKASEIEVEKVEGAYYVLLPSSQLQRVQFVTENDRQNMAYTARLSYRNEAAPVFVYTAQEYQPTAAYVEIKQQ